MLKDPALNLIRAVSSQRFRQYWHLLLLPPSHSSFQSVYPPFQKSWTTISASCTPGGRIHCLFELPGIPVRARQISLGQDSAVFHGDLGHLGQMPGRATVPSERW